MALRATFRAALTMSALRGHKRTWATDRVRLAAPRTELVRDELRHKKLPQIASAAVESDLTVGFAY